MIFFPSGKKLQQEYNSERIDIVFDTYKYTIMKASKRIEREKVIRQKLQDESIATTNWCGFLRLHQNKPDYSNTFPKKCYYMLKKI